MKTRFRISLITTLFLLSCNSYNKDHIQDSTQNIIASVDSIPILCDSVDNLVKQELYDELCRIYLIRKVTLERIIKNKILQLEAEKFNYTVEELESSLFKNRITEANLKMFSGKTNYPGKISELRETLVFHDTKSARGHDLLVTRYKEYLLNQYIDSLKKLHNIKILLTPPHPPKISIDNLIIHYKGSTNAKVTFLLVTDFDCHMCREENPLFEKLYQKYKDKVRFGFTHYSSYVSNSALASECAANQDKFWEMHDSIFSPKMIPDSVALFRMAKNLKLDMARFSADYKNKTLSENIKANLYKLEAAGIYGTPTIMINDRLIFNNTSVGEIENLLKEEIEKSE